MTTLPEISVNTTGQFGIDNLDALLVEFPLLAKRAVNSANRSEGNRLKLVIQRVIRSGGPSSAKWEKAHPWANVLKSARRSGNWFNKKGRSDLAAAGNQLLKFADGVRYVADDEKSRVEIGFVNPNVNFQDYLDKAETGFETPVTDRMRRLFFGLGLALSPSTHALKSPARPLIGPVFESEKSTIAANLEQKFFANLERYASGGGKK